uniref:Putative secreted protein n=1 Tax=Xenopsylla cheopis TaxID=163159 RepID=A0A6M2DUG0_XENCH
MKGLLRTKMIKFLILLCCLAVIASAIPYGESRDRDSEHLGRVQIKVYRGPTDDAEEYAPWGFWVKQPAEDNY